MPRRTSATSNMVSVRPLRAFQWRTDRISTDTGSFLFLVGHVEATYPGHRFHCEVNLGLRLKSLPPTPPKEKIQEKYQREYSSRMGSVRVVKQDERGGSRGSGPVRPCNSSISL